MYPCIYPCLICTEYVEEIFQTFLNATKDDLKKAAKQLKENTPPAMNMMFKKQLKAEAVKKRDERKKIVKNVPPTTPGIKALKHIGIIKLFCTVSLQSAYMWITQYACC